MDEAMSLHIAARKGNAVRLGELLASGADVNVPDEKDGRTPLMCACAADVNDAMSLEAVNLLLASGANIEARDPQGFTSLMYSVKFRNLAALRRLLDAGAEVNALNAKGQTALTIASGIGFWDKLKEAVRLLQDRGGKKVRKYLWSDTGEDRRTLAEAAHDEDIDAVRRLLAQGPPQYDKDRALSNAANTGRVDIARELLAAGADPRHHGDCLYYAVLGNARVEMLQLLVGAGADPNVVDMTSDRKTPLWWARHCKYWDLVRFLEPLTAKPKKLRDRYKGKYALGTVENQWRALMLVRTGIDAAEAALATLLPGTQVIRDVAEKLVDLPQWCLLVFQLKTHPWTCVLALSRSTDIDTDTMAQKLAGHCSAEAISYDTGEDSDRRLTLFGANGEELEFLGHLPGQEETFVARSKERDLSSVHPDTEAEELKLINGLLKPREALIPPIGCQIADGEAPYHFAALDIASHEVVRMDVVGFKGAWL